jgi:hypothetical protein
MQLLRVQKPWCIGLKKQVEAERLQRRDIRGEADRLRDMNMRLLQEKTATERSRDGEALMQRDKAHLAAERDALLDKVARLEGACSCRLLTWNVGVASAVKIILCTLLVAAPIEVKSDVYAQRGC